MDLLQFKIQLFRWKNQSRDQGKESVRQTQPELTISNSRKTPAEGPNNRD